MTTTPEVAAQLKASVRLAVDSLNCVFGSLPTRVVPDGQGGAWVELSDVALGPPFAQETSFLVFLLPFNLPGSDIYPMFVRSDLSRVDGNPLGAAFQSTQLAWPGDPAARPVVQVSRRTRGAFASQTAAQKVCKVLEWMRST